MGVAEEPGLKEARLGVGGGQAWDVEGAGLGQKTEGATGGQYMEAQHRGKEHQWPELTGERCLGEGQGKGPEGTLPVDGR